MGIEAILLEQLPRIGQDSQALLTAAGAQARVGKSEAQRAGSPSGEAWLGSIATCRWLLR